MKVFWTVFLLLQIGFVIFGLENIVAKAAKKMLMKLATGVRFNNLCCTVVPKI